MKKLVIATAIIITSGITAISVAKAFEPKAVAPKIDTTELLKKGFSDQKNDLSSAD